MITLGKRGDLWARRQAGAFLMTQEAVRKLWEIAPRFGDREGGYLRIVRTAFQRGDGAEKAFVELVGSEKVIQEKREKRAEVRAKKAEATRKAMEEETKQAEAESAAEAEGGETGGGEKKE